MINNESEDSISPLAQSQESSEVTAEWLDALETLRGWRESSFSYAEDLAVVSVNSLPRMQRSSPAATTSLSSLARGSRLIKSNSDLGTPNSIGSPLIPSGISNIRFLPRLSSSSPVGSPSTTISRHSSAAELKQRRPTKHNIVINDYAADIISNVNSASSSDNLDYLYNDGNDDFVELADEETPFIQSASDIKVNVSSGCDSNESIALSHEVQPILGNTLQLDYCSTAILLFNVMLYALAWQLFAPMIPYFLQSMGGDQFQYGYLMGLNSFTQMIGAFFGGPLIDKYGSRLAAIISYTAAAGSFLLAYYSRSPLELIASRIPNLCQQAILASRTFLSTRSNSDARLLSYISLSYGLGSMLGPAIASLIVRLVSQESGVIADINIDQRNSGNSKNGPALRVILLVSTVISACSALLASASMPSPQQSSAAPSGTTTTTDQLPGKADRAHQRPISASSLQRRHSLDGRWLWRRLISSREMQSKSLRTVRLILAYKSCISFSSALFHTMLPVMLLSDRYRLGPADNGWVFSYIGVIVVVAQLLFNRVYLSNCGTAITHQQNDLHWLLGASTAMSLSFAAVGVLAVDLRQLCIWLVPLMSAGTVIFTISTSMLTRMVDQRIAGSLIGLDMAVTGVLRVLAPLIGTALSAWFGGDVGIGVCCAIFVAASIPLLARLRTEL